MYVVRVCVQDEYFDSDSADNSRFFGPYKTRDKAQKVADGVVRLCKGKKDGEVYAGVESIERAGVREIARQFK